MSLKIDHVYRSFGQVKAVRDVWLDVPEGTVMGVIGPNGAGKTTTMRMVLRIIPPESGTISWAGKPIAAWPLGTFGYLPEERGLYPQMKSRDELRFFARLHGLTAKRADQEIDHWADILAFDDILSKRVDELSKGNAQKLQFLAAVLHRPRLIILDEPFSGLDPVNSRLFKEAIKHLHELGSTILFSSHQMDNVEELCEHVCLIARGRTILHGPITEVRRSAGKRILTIRLGDAPIVSQGTDCQATGHIDPLGNAVGVRLIEGALGEWRYELSPGMDSDTLLRDLLKRGQVEHFSVDYPGLEDIYLAHVSQDAQETEPCEMRKGASA